jgi:hypothetical protein
MSSSSTASSSRGKRERSEVDNEGEGEVDQAMREKIARKDARVSRVVQTSPSLATTLPLDNPFSSFATPHPCTSLPSPVLYFSLHG